MKKIAATITLAVGVVLAGCAVPAEEPVAVQSSGGAKAGKATGKAKKKTVPVKLVAKRTTAKASILSDGSPLSCARVAVTNQSKKNVEVNPLYFSLTDTKDTKHDAGSAMGTYENEMPTTALAPGENAKGVVCAKGKFTPKVVAMTNELFGEAARAQVA
ncbi:DUF4352 domain-containing protein [Actinomadura sp. 9N215]|uniref:DUF4352 domain-containing protein n=1 Tax=Actinomadura sp. 9N215 TaxID=3375150 RepID=UPI0037999948